MRLEGVSSADTPLLSCAYCRTRNVGIARQVECAAVEKILIFAHISRMAVVALCYKRKVCISLGYLLYFAVAQDTESTTSEGFAHVG